MAAVQRQKAETAEELKPGDYVAWRYRRGEAHGHVVEKLTRDKKMNARTFKATEGNPKYLIRSDKSGKEVIRNPQTLRKIGENEEERHDSGVESEDSGSHDEENKEMGGMKDATSPSARRLPHEENPQPGQFTDIASI